MRSYIDNEGNTIIEMDADEAEKLQMALFAGYHALDNAYMEEDGQPLYDLAYTIDY